jgi:hypothetical protein
MDRFVGLHGIITDPDTAINDPDALVEVSLEGKGTHRLPQDCMRPIDELMFVRLLFGMQKLVGRI